MIDNSEREDKRTPLEKLNDEIRTARDFVNAGYEQGASYDAIRPYEAKLKALLHRRRDYPQGKPPTS